MIQRKLADMATRLYVAGAIAYRTAGLLDAAIAQLPAAGSERDAGLRAVLEEYTVECSVVKVFGTECAPRRPAAAPRPRRPRASQKTPRAPEGKDEDIKSPEKKEEKSSESKASPRDGGGQEAEEIVVADRKK